KYAGIIFLHWGQGDRSEFVWEAALYANAGAISITLDAPWNRPEPWKQPGEDFNNPDQSKQMYIQNIKDLRRAVDLLIESGNVDPERIAYIGHSFGATQGGVFAGVEKRIKTFVLMGGLPSLVDFSTKGARKFDNLVALLDTYFSEEQLKKYIDVLTPLTPANFIGHTAPSSIFMQFGKYDSWIPEQAAENYFNAASEPKEMKWYLTSHEFTDLGALVDRAEWLKNEVGIDSIINLLEMYLQ
ncbi:alpha/beta hydrolase family protein, partial [Bacteroidota bacterium]